MNSTLPYSYGPINIKQVKEDISDINESIGNINDSIENISDDIDTLKNQSPKNYAFNITQETLAIPAASNQVYGTAIYTAPSITGKTLKAIIVLNYYVSGDMYLNTEYWKLFYRMDIYTRRVTFSNPTNAQIGIDANFLCIYESV